MRRKRKKQIDEEIPYEYRDLTSLPIPLDAQRGMWTKPEIMVVGSKDSNNAVHPLKIDTTGRLDVVGVCPEHQALVSQQQTNPVSGTQYELLPETELIRIITVGLRCTNSVTPTLECHITVDGNVLTFTKANATSNQWQTPAVDYNQTEAGQPLITGTGQRVRQFIFEARSASITVEVTGGTVTDLRSNIYYALW